MRVSIGDRLGRFEILGALGSGGMGDVYRARDPQLQRDVAIKVLPPEWSDDPARQRRLEQEARAAASLSHSNIVTVYDFGFHEGRAFVVSELLQGETLRGSMRGRPLPPAKAVEYAMQIANGLAAGHDRGITHRDIKPENVFVTRDGLVKILDFGLAIQNDRELSSAATNTITIDGVQAASIGGTATYMSPEQARGLGADHRSDIFSLGSVLCEMLTGSPPFRRDTVADTVSAILNEEPQGLSSVSGVTPALERIVRHCLEKRPEDRFQHARDLIFALQSSTAASPVSVGVPARPRFGTQTARTALSLVALAAAAAVAFFAGTRAAVTSSPAVIDGVRRVTELPGLEEFPSISPDRRAVAFTASVNGSRQVFVRLLAGGPPLAITKAPGDHEQPRWSPDGNSLVYFARGGDDDGAIWAIPSLGGSPRRLMACMGGGDVSRSGRLTCFRLADGKIQLVTAALDGSDVRVVLPSSAGYHRYPRWSPDSRWIAFQQGDGVRDDVFVVPATGGEARRLTNDRNVIGGLAWLPSSDGIVYASSRGSTVPYLPSLRLWSVRLDGGPARPLTPADASYEQPDVHAMGLASVARLRMRFDLWRFPTEGTASDNVTRAEQVTRQTGQVLTPTSAPNGDEIAFLADHGGRANLWVMSTHSGEMRQITFESDPAVAVGAPGWSPDGESIAFVSSKGNSGYDFGLWAVNPDGGNLRNMAKLGLGFAWSPDGKWLYYSDTSAGSLKKVRSSGGDALVVRKEPTRNVIGLHEGTLYYMVERPLVDGRPEFEIRAASPEDGPSSLVARIPASRVATWQIVNPALSPDGQLLAMPLSDGFATNVWVLSIKTGEWRQVTDFGQRAIFIARRVSWSADGKFIFAAVGEGDADIVLLDGVT
jgi:eukaryotic-like serine/threonine-protein kinase